MCQKKRRLSLKMAKTRMVNTRFWSDIFVQSLKPLEKYLFLYFLTNEHTNIAGVYELSMKTVSFETGIPLKQIDALTPSLKGKIYFIDGWVYIKNFQNHQKTSSKQVVKGIKAELNKVPEGIKKKIEGIDTLSGHIDTSNISISISKSISVSQLKSKRKVLRSASADVSKPCTKSKNGFHDFPARGASCNNLCGEVQIVPAGVKIRGLKSINE